MIRSTTCNSPWPKPLPGLAVLLAALLLALPVRAQPASLEKAMNPLPFGEETGVFRRLLFEMNFQPVQKIDNANPADTVVIVLGDSSRLTRFPGDRLFNFVQRGGAVLVASDKPSPSAVLADVSGLTGYRIFPYHVRYVGTDADKAAHCYNGIDFCPILVPVNPKTNRFFWNPNDNNRPTLRVATNIPAVLEANPGLVGRGGIIQPQPPVVDRTHLEERAKLPAGCTPEDPRVAMPRDRTLMVSQKTPGRLLFLADHSIFINYMMLPEDNDNVEFAKNCMDWLSEDDSGKRVRSKVLFLEDGAIQSTFKVALKPDPGRMPWDAEGRLLNKMNAGIDRGNGVLMEAERTDFFNQAIHRLLTWENPSPWKMVGGLFVVLTLLALLAGFVRLVYHGFQNQNPVAPNLARMVEIQEPADSLMEQRNQGMMKVGNLWEVGRQLARQAFEGAGVAGKTGDKVPIIQAAGGWWARQKRRREVAWLWALAFDKQPPRVRPSQWPGLLRQIDELRRALANGSVRLG
jgi:hypothetical protein